MSTTQYGIGVTKNRFELFDIEDEDPLEVLKIREQEKEAKKKTKLCEKENKGKEPAVKVKTVPARKGIKETQNLKPQDVQKAKEDKPRAPRVERGERKVGPGPAGDNREDRNNRKNREERPPSDFQSREDRGERVERKEFKGDRPAPAYGGDSTGETRGRGRGGRGGFAPRGGRGGGRGGGSRPGFDARGKREYDRQSGSDKTGVKAVDKREGGGAHNWGNHRDDLEEISNQLNQPNDENTWQSPEKPEGETPAPEPNTTTEGGEDVNPTTAEEEKKELTLDEWKALKAPRQKPTYNLRKAGEGEDPSQWKKMYALQKKKEGEEYDEEEEYEYEEYPQRVGRQKHILDIDIHFKDTRGGGRGRGGRGAGRGNPRMGARGGGNNNPPGPEKFTHQGRDLGQKSAPKVDDEHDFPSLG